AAGVRRTAAEGTSPNDHFGARPDRPWEVSCRGVRGAGLCPGVVRGIVTVARRDDSPSSVLPLPDDHLAARPDSAGINPGSGAVGSPCPAIGRRVVALARFRNIGNAVSAV